MSTLTVYIMAVLAGMFAEARPLDHLVVTPGHHMVIVRANNARYVMRREAMRRYLSKYDAVKSDELDAILHHCERPVAALVDAHANLNASLYRRPKSTLVYVARSGTMN